ncbi:MAG: hypothetical protein HUJ68_04185 [Clostridia bacterium]|nr:hypothetical protein [Clostridia bacterium]
MKTVEFKCPLCGHEWTKQFTDNIDIWIRRKCPSCLRYSDNCLKPLNFFEKMKKEQNLKK